MFRACFSDKHRRSLAFLSDPLNPDRRSQINGKPVIPHSVSIVPDEALIICK